MTDAKAARRPTALIAVMVLACLCGGVSLIVSGSRSHPPPDASLPVSQFAVSPRVLGQLPPLGPGTITATGGQPGTRCSFQVTRSRLVIPSLCINGPIVPTYQQRDGALMIPRDVREIAMWNDGARLAGLNGSPVHLGTTLLAGHVDYAGQGDGTLFDLYQVQPGAVVYTSDAAGLVTRWRVTSLVVALKSRLPSWVFAGLDGPRKLVIVTCGGPVDYVPGYGYSYADNVIATAVPALARGRDRPTKQRHEAKERIHMGEMARRQGRLATCAAAAVIVAVIAGGCTAQPGGNGNSPGRGARPAPAAAAAATGRAGAGAPARARAAARAAAIPLKVPNSVSARKNVVQTACAATSAGGHAAGTVTAGRSAMTYTITVFFTTSKATVLDYGITKVRAAPGKMTPWSVTAHFKAPKGMLCVLRGVSAG